MKKQKTMRSLVLSLIALMMSLTMLVGSTFAWFTDSVVSRNNIITAGNLDVELEYKMNSEDDWAPVTEDLALFNDEALWEPGHTEVVALRISNKGTLSLKYELSTSVYSEKAGTNAYGKEFKLSEHLKVGHSAIQQYNEVGEILMDMMLENRNAALSYAEVGFDNVIPVPTSYIEPGEGHVVALTITMPTTVGNEANYKTGTEAPEIKFGVELVATQHTSEFDSFDNQYDKDATYPEVIIYDYEVSTLDELLEAFANGGNVKLKNDIQLEKITPIEPGAEVYLNMNGKTITVNPNTASNTLIYVKEDAKLVVDGNGTIDMGDTNRIAIFAPYGELVIENGTFIRNELSDAAIADNKTTGLFMGAKSTKSNVTINSGYFDSGYYDKNVELEFNETNADLIRTAYKDNISLLLNHSGYGSFKVYGGTFVGANPAWGDEGCMLPTTPNNLRPWSYYQGALLDSQVAHDDKIEIPAGYTITETQATDGRPVYTVKYSK